MKISCPSCSAKYSIADEKVQDRLAKIRCRKCGTTIVIDGKQDPPSVQAAETVAKAETGEPSSSAEPAPEGTYAVDVADDDQRTMTVEDIVEAYNAGTITADTYVWKDGMGDWEPLADVPEVYDALHAAASEDGSAGGGAQGAGIFGLAAAAGSQSDGAGDWSSSATDTGSAPETALRSGAGRGSAADLFGSINTAGSEQEITTSAAGSAVAATGARNESSVLFSLSALTATPEENSAASNVTEDSGLIDLAALTASSGADEGPKQAPALDLGSAPLGAAPLGLGAAPFGNPSPGFSVDALPAQQQQQGSSKNGIFIGTGIAIAALVIGGVIWAKDDPSPVAAPVAPPATVILTAPPPESAPAAADRAEEQDPTKAEEKDTPEDTAEADKQAANAAAPPTKRRTYSKPKQTAPVAKPTKPVKKAAPKPATKAPAKKKKKKKTCNCKPNDLMCAMKCSAK